MHKILQVGPRGSAAHAARERRAPTFKQLCLESGDILRSIPQQTRRPPLHSKTYKKIYPTELERV
jgi:hypothetical protein